MQWPRKICLHTIDGYVSSHLAIFGNNQRRKSHTGCSPHGLTTFVTSHAHCFTLNTRVCMLSLRVMASMSFSMRLPEEPNQPDNFAFPKQSFGKKQSVKRSFQSTWFCRWKWLHYEEAIDFAFCHICGRTEQEVKLKAGSKEQAFCWRDFATGRMLRIAFNDMNKVSVTKMLYKWWWCSQICSWHWWNAIYCPHSKQSRN